MRQAADRAETREMKDTFLRLEASWLRLAVAAEDSVSVDKNNGETSH